MKKFVISCILAFSMLIAVPAAAQEPIPGIASISESSGTTSGGNVVSATGVNFSELTTVTVNGVSAGVQYIDSSTINITMPPGSEGRATIYVTNDGLVSTESMGSYTYVAPEPVADPVPEPEPVVEPTPEPVVDTVPALPAPPAPSQNTQVATIDEPREVVEPTIEAVEKQVVEETAKTSYLSDNAYILYDDNNNENLVVNTEYEVPQKFVLSKRVDGEWIYVDKSYQFDSVVVFLDTNLELGYTYKVIVEIDGKKTIAAWFDVLTKQYTVI